MEDGYRVEEVTDVRWKDGIEDGTREYCVKWLNYAHKDNTWEAKSPDLDEFIEEYWQEMYGHRAPSV